MTGRELTSLAIKVFAIYVLVQAVFAVAGLVVVLHEGRTWLSQGLSTFWIWALGAVAAALLFIFVVVMWRLSRKIVQPPPFGLPETNAASITEAFVLSVLGLYWVFEGLLRSALLSLGTYAALSSFAGTEVHGVWARTIAYLGCYGVQIVVGLTLILRTNGWAALLRRLREAGLGSK